MKFLKDKTKRFWIIIIAVIIGIVVILVGYEGVKIIQSRFLQPLII